MAAWPTALRDRALMLGRIVAEAAHWPKPFFLPQDSFAVAAYGPRLLEYQEHPVEDIAFEAAIRFPTTEAFWRAALEKTFGAVVAELRVGA